MTAECAAGFLVIGGRLVVSEPPDVGDTDPELGGMPPAWPWSASRHEGIRDGCQVLAAVGPCPDRYPRRVGIPAKRPLFD